MSRPLLIAATAAEAHLAVAQHALEEAKRCIFSLPPHADIDLAAEDALMKVKQIRAKLDILRKRIP